MSSALTFFRANALSRCVSASVRGRVIFPSPSAPSVAVVNPHLSERLSEHRISQSLEARRGGPDQAEVFERWSTARPPFLPTPAVWTLSFALGPQPQPNQAADSFGAGRNVVLCPPKIDRGKLRFLPAHADLNAFAGCRRPAAPLFRGTLN